MMVFAMNAVKRKTMKPTKKQISYWQSMIGKQGNGFKKGHKDIVTKKGRQSQGLKMLGNQYGFRKGRRYTLDEINKRTKTRRKNGWNKNPERTSLLHSQARLRIKIPFKDTSIEVKMQNILKENNIDFEKHKAIVGQPDIFIEPNICIFCDGDYWHNLPGRRQKDYIVTKKLKEQGYQVLRLWEHEINKNIDKCFNIIKKRICKKYDVAVATNIKMFLK